MLQRFCRVVDSLNEWTGKIVRWLILPMVVIVTWEVATRYLFNKPTIWAWDINVQLLGALVALGAGYGLLHGAHVPMDVLVIKLSLRSRALLDLITSVFFFFIIGVVLWITATTAWSSLQTREISSSFFAPPVYPLRIAIAVGVFLLLLQGIVKFIRDLFTLISVNQGTK